MIDVAPVMNATPPYAYVVDYRPLDACAPPTCPIRARQVSGFATQIQSDGDPGAYVLAGHSLAKELYFRRGITLRPDETYTFTLPPSAAESELDAYLSAAASGQGYRARVTVSEVRPTGGPAAIDTHAFEGTSAPFAIPTAETEGDASRFSTHVRLPLPPRAGRLVRVAITNVGASKLNVGTPVVMRKVEGRGPRQLVFAVFDAVPFHLMDAMLRGETGEAKTAWLGDAVGASGVYFPDAVSPGQATVSFFSRFLQGELWAGRGWPGMYGTGAIDESLPEHETGPIARLAGEGFLTELVGSNFLLAPTVAHVAFDGGYQIESPTHATAMERHVVRWAADHPRDDAALMLWNAQTHAPYPPGRPSPDAPKPKGLPEVELNADANTAVWRNLTDGVDRLAGELAALRAAAPDASRVVWIGADHSRGITRKMQKRAYRTWGGVGTDISHGSANTVEEMRTPYAVLFDGPSRPSLSSHVSPGRSSSIAFWRVVESRFDVDLGLTPSTTFDHPLFSGARVANPWQDRVFVAPGIGGSMRVMAGDLAYGLFSTAPVGGRALWALPDREQRVMLGAPSRTGPLVAEELYDAAADPYELVNVANDRWDDVLRLRRELVDFVAAHYDPPDHPRHVYTLVLPERVQLRLSSLGKLRVLVDGEPVPSVDPRAVVVTASKLDIVETEGPLGVVEVAALDREAPVVLKCAANGLVLDRLSDDRPRLGLALARTNCPLPATGREVARPGEILFTVRRARREDMGSAARVDAAGGPAQGGVDRDEFLQGMKRWGYVRDIDPSKP